MAALSLRRSTRIASVMNTKNTISGSSSSVSLTRGRARSVSSSLSPPPEPSPDPNSRPRKRARTENKQSPSGETYVESGIVEKPLRRKKPLQHPEPKPEDFATRATNPWKIGPHVSSAGGVENALANAAAVGANAFAIFLKSQRKWESKSLASDSIAKFKDRMKAFGYSPSHILPHGSYLVNLGNPDREKREKSFACFLDDLKRCEQLGLQLYNFHPGSTVGAGTIEESLSLIAECINCAHAETTSVVIVLENMAGAGNVIGSRFSDLGGIIEQVHDKSRVGVCLDTCHMYAAVSVLNSPPDSICLTRYRLQGYDITTLEGWNTTMDEFDREVGIKYLRGMHLNDSKAALGSKKDRHENIGLGHLGLRTFAHILADPRTRDLPLILETPAYDVPASSAAARESLATEGMGVWRTEVSVLNRLSGRNVAEEGQKNARVVGEDELEEMREEIAAAVKKASALRDAKGKKAGAVTGKPKKGSKKQATQEEVDDEDEDGRSCCKSEH
ncbi:xylose isomerase-like protein [Trametes polyzona]|nr:xylose isomerase-like protein [Trametes polyzona]